MVSIWHPHVACSDQLDRALPIWLLQCCHQSVVTVIVMASCSLLDREGAMCVYSFVFRSPIIHAGDAMSFFDKLFGKKPAKDEKNAANNNANAKSDTAQSSSGGSGGTGSGGAKE